MSNGLTPETLARYLRWGIFVFLGYVLLHNGFHLFSTTPAQPVANPKTTAAAASTRNCDDTNPFKNFSILAMPLITEVTPSVRFDDTTVGTGAPAQCGQNAKLRFEYLTQNGAVLYSTMESSQTPSDIHIGDHKLLRGAEMDLLGMKAGGVRKMSIPPTLAFGGLKDLNDLEGHDSFTIPKGMPLGREPILAQVQLLSLSPETPTSTQPLRTINASFGNGPAYVCGETVYANLSIWKLDGTRIFTTTETGPIAFTLGNSQVPYGIEQAALNMRNGAMRTIILPPAYAKPLNPSASASALPANILPAETVLVEMEIVPEPIKPAPPAPATSTPTHP